MRRKKKKKRLLSSKNVLAYVHKNVLAYTDRCDPAVVLMYEKQEGWSGPSWIP